MRLLILGTGHMANAHARNFIEIDGVTLAGAVDVDQNRVEAFREKYSIERAFTSLEEALAWGDFDAVANVTPDSAHHATTLKCLAAGKHVFCEKPLATNYHDAMEMAEKAEAANLVGMVNLTYRNVAQLQAARKLVTSGQIGKIRHVEASYLQSWLVSKQWGDWRTESQWLWRLSKKHGSNGTLGDVGVHILDFVVYGTDTEIDEVFCRLKAFDKAEGNRIGEYELDANDSFTMTVSFTNGALGVVHSSRWATGHVNELRLRVYGDKGSFEVVHRHDGSKLLACLGDDIETATWKEIEVEPVPTNYQRFVDAVGQGKALEPSFRHAAKLQKAIDLANVTESDRKEHRLQG
ncbi:Gfo/Idh/MocA family protein [Phyllobacterium zundukense]|uniref:Oxidoreductase n=1 Tax=Phyllobacterium zundukense TaxID=1867719 RepID=A0A2N9W1H7_9HYPH|nr:Gfo/Idh/MocA family oxidoreductase [Phyllobacterium zundukense]ATU91632.1 oxidoreductase [Phyllobacterium zundukense]PIO45595.1 oxidoreductase [Phyllobacterium zundukense]